MRYGAFQDAFTEEVWRAVLSSRLQGEIGPERVVQLLREGMFARGSPVFGFVEKLCSPSHHFPPRPSSGLLPISLPAARRHLESLGGLNPAALAWVEMMIVAVNWLFCVGGSSIPVNLQFPNSLLPVQEEALRGFVDAALWVLDGCKSVHVPSEIEAELNDLKVDYAGGVVCQNVGSCRRI